MAHLVEFGGVITKRWSPERVDGNSVTRFRRAVSKSNAQDSFLLVFLTEVPELMGVRSQNRKRLLRLDEDEKLKLNL